MRSQIIPMLLATILAAVSLRSQAPAGSRPLAFDVVSVKPNTSGEQGGSSRAQPGRYQGINVTLKRVIGLASSTAPSPPKTDSASSYDRPVSRPLTVFEDREFHRWGMVSGAPHRSLRPHVRRYVGWWEHRTTPLYRRELPSAEVPLIISFGAPIRLFEVSDRAKSTELGSFATGAYDAHVVVEANGSQGGIQIDFTILGMRLFLGRPLADLTNRGIALEDIFGSDARRLTSELRDVPTWEARFDLLDREIAARISSARRPASEVLCTWKRIVENNGRVTIRALVDETGWSQKHLISQFREHIGLAPKMFARVMRFGSAVDRLRRKEHASLTELALDCGYYDQAHFDRDFRAFAGITPTELLSTLGSHGGFSSE